MNKLPSRTMMPRLRRWATPLTMGSFVLMSATGVLMFFGWEDGLTVVVHQWFSWLFLLGVGGHIAVNIRAFMSHLGSRPGKASLTIFMIVLFLSFSSWGLVTGPQLKRPIEQALVDAPLSALADVTRTNLDALLDRLKAHGIVASGKESIHEIAAKNGGSETRLLAIVFTHE
jgi:hypothetical protein